jgi:hypothetical protein
VLKRAKIQLIFVFDGPGHPLFKQGMDVKSGKPHWSITSRVSLRTSVVPSIRLCIPSSIPLFLIDNDVFSQAPGEAEAELDQLTAHG